MRKRRRQQLEGARFTITGCRLWIEHGQLHVRPDGPWVEVPAVAWCRFNGDAVDNTTGLILHNLDGSVVVSVLAGGGCLVYDNEIMVL